MLQFFVILFDNVLESVSYTHLDIPSGAAAKGAFCDFPCRWLKYYASITEPVQSGAA